MCYLKLLLLFSVISHSWIYIDKGPHHTTGYSQFLDFESEEGEEDEDNEELAA